MVISKQLKNDKDEQIGEESPKADFLPLNFREVMSRRTEEPMANNAITRRMKNEVDNGKGGIALEAGVVLKMQAGEDYEKTTLVEDQAFVAPGIESEYATTMTQEVLDGRAY